MLAAELRASTAKPSPVLIWGALGGLAELLWWSSLQTNLNLHISYLRTAEILTPKSRCLITGVQCNKGRGCEILKLAFFMRLSNSESRVTLGFIIYSVRAGQALLVYRLQPSFLNPVRTQYSACSLPSTCCDCRVPRDLELKSQQLQIQPCPGVPAGVFSVPLTR